MIKLQVINILEYYDYPQLILCKDQVSTIYIAILGSAVDKLHYIATKISIERLNSLKQNKEDLLSVFLEPELDEFYEFKLDEKSEKVFAAQLVAIDKIKAFFPESDLYIGDDDYKLKLDNISETENQFIYELYIKEKGKANSVSSELLLVYLKLTQNLFKYGFLEALKTLSTQIKDRINENGTLLNIFSFGTGSLRVFFKTNSYVDMHGYSDDEILISKLKELFEIDLINTTEIISFLRNNKGHFISTIKNLCIKVTETKIPFKLSYTCVNVQKKGEFLIDDNKASIYYSLIQAEKELTEIHVQLNGFFIILNSKDGKWRLRKADDGKEIFGISEQKILAGLKIKTQLYQLNCIEKIIETNINPKDKKIYELLDIKEL